MAVIGCSQLENLETGQNDLKTLKDSVNELENKVKSLNTIDAKIQESKETQKNLKPKYEDYFDAQGSLKSLGDPTELGTQLRDSENNISLMKDKVSSLIEVTGGSVENLGEQIEYFTELNSKYQRLSGAVELKESSSTKMQEVQNSITDIKKEISQLKQELEEIAYDTEVHKQLKIIIQEKQDELTNLTGQQKELIGMENGAKNSLEGLNKQLESYEEFKKEQSILRDFIKLLEYIREIYGKDGVQKDLRDISRPLIEQNTRDFFEKFNFEYSDIRLDNDYDVIVYGPAGESNLDMISGGEKIAVALALRLGITKTLSGGSLELIMLDEPTIHLDAYRRQELIDLLKKMSIIPQMIIVTHDSDLEDAADNILKVEKEEGISVVYP